MATYASFAAPGQLLLPSAPSLESEIQRHHERLYRAALQQLHNPADAQDALQEALLLAHRNLHQFAGRSQLLTWLTRIVINSSRSYRRRARAHPLASLEEIPAVGSAHPDPRPSPEALCAERERHQRLHLLLRRLSPALRRAVEVCDLEGQSLPAAACTLGISPAALKCRLFRARQRLHALASSSAH